MTQELQIELIQCNNKTQGEPPDLELMLLCYLFSDGTIPFSSVCVQTHTVILLLLIIGL